MSTAHLGLVRSDADRHAAIERYDLLDRPTEAAFDAIVRLVADLLDTPIAAINLLARDRQWFQAEVGLGVRELPLEGAFCSTVILEQSMLVVPDATQDPRFACFPIVVGAAGVRFYAGALLVTSDGIPIGTLCVADTRPRPDGVTALQRMGLRTLADQVIAQMELRRMQREKQDLALALRERELALDASMRAQRALRHNEAGLHSLVQASCRVVWTATPDGSRFRSHGWANTTGNAGEGALVEGWLATVHPDDRDGAGAAWRAAVAAGAPFEHGYRLRTTDGSYRRVVGLGHPIVGEDGLVREWVGTISDADEPT